ncbi:flavin-containing monooxygenase [Trujillonella endophytica]|uniref:Predicted flavoprotein CzcO associated with the cation diffusion facilitator CzcD n=1 Tax=Trujillonella endophytica TaxID=673521 RepID=A0A1H8UPY6_9ACTN|nr:NAD(P)/FAD-dependent oxidoreductase [Trujillella endophytica]SEP05176.1 Predicted flavoprotein CzcO associated with the cation diffusion facilitator CzcD [Trujillella endophytica]
MTGPSMASGTEEDGATAGAPVDVLVIGAGVTGIYQLWRAREAGYSVTLLEAADGPGGVWHWNRYPGARFDSESWSYGFLFSEELWQEWEWSEQYAGQPEIEGYFDFVLDRCDMRRHIEFGAKVTSVVFDEATGISTVGTQDGRTWRARYVVAASGNLSVPFIPAIEGREAFRGRQLHTGLWPKESVDFRGLRVAQIGTGSSGVQIVPAIADEVANLTVYQMNADWVTPLNNRPIPPEEHADLKARFAEIVAALDASPSGFLHTSTGRKSTEDTREQWQELFEQMWASSGFRKLTESYIDLLFNPEVNREWCEFMAAKIRAIVSDPVTAERLIPKDSGYGGRRPPFGTGYYEAYNNPNVDLVSLRETPILRITETGIETSEGHREYDVIIWATGYDFGTGALNRLGVRGRQGLALEEHWADGPRTYLGIMTAGFPNFFFPGGPHGALGNNPRYAGDQVDYVMDVLLHAREHGQDVVEVDDAAEEQWTAMMNDSSRMSSFLDSSYFYGGNIPGKPVRQLLNPTGRPTLRKMMARDAETGFPTLTFSKLQVPAA